MTLLPRSGKMSTRTSVPLKKQELHKPHLELCRRKMFLPFLRFHQTVLNHRLTPSLSKSQGTRRRNVRDTKARPPRNGQNGNARRRKRKRKGNPRRLKITIRIVNRRH